MDNTHKIKNLLLGIFLILFFASVYFARDMFLPIVIGLLVALTLSPVVRGLARSGIPEPVSAIVLIFGAIVTIGIGAYLLTGPVSAILADVPQLGDQLRIKLSHLLESVEAVQEASEEVEDLANGTDAQTPKVAIQQPGLMAFAAGSIANFLALVVVGLILAMFLLASGDLFYVKLVNAIPTFSDKRRAVKAVRDVERQISHYFLAITAINAALGICIGLGLMWLGLPNAIMWGVFAFALNFLPFVGAIVGTVLVGIYGIIQFDTLSLGLAAPAIYFFFTTLEGQFLTPAILGHRLELNTVSVFLTVIVWSWLWSVPGALMAVPFLVMVKVISDNVEQLRTFGSFLGTRAPSPDT